MNSPLLLMVKESLIILPSPSSLSYKWNYGFMLSMCLGTQILTGLILTMHYSPNIDLAFLSVIELSRNMDSGWWMRFIHANGASLFFILLYAHVGRGVYFSSFNLVETWNIGVVILMVTMMTAFFGYVLPWGQMSFWGATVITNLLSVIPYLGKMLVEWIWGGFSVSNPTLNRFYTFHFIFPFIILALVILHLMFLHETGSNNPGGVNSNLDKITFYPFFLWKDLMYFILILVGFATTLINYPFLLGDPENFILANPMVTPVHIQPEWYLLFAYSILRAIPNKIGGVVALATSLMILFLMPLTSPKKMNCTTNSIFGKMAFWSLVLVVLTLTWLGACPVEPPYIFTGQIFTFLYFFVFFVIMALASLLPGLI